MGEERLGDARFRERVGEAEEHEEDERHEH
jgi:hypothetical protein